MTTFFDENEKQRSNVYYRQDSRRRLRCKFETGDTAYVKIDDKYHETKVTNIIVTNTLVYCKTQLLVNPIDEGNLLTINEWKLIKD